MIVRRGILFYLALLVLQKKWLQVLVFMALNLISLVYLIEAKPYKDSQNNSLNIYNELVILVCSYFITQINDLRYDPEAAYRIGDFIKIILYFCWGTNLLIIIYIIFSILKLTARKYYYTKLRWNYECLKPKAQQPK